MCVIVWLPRTSDRWVVGRELMVSTSEKEMVDSGEKKVWALLRRLSCTEDRKDLVVFGNRKRQALVER